MNAANNLIFGTLDCPVQIENFESHPFVDYIEEEVLEQKKIYWEQSGFAYIHVLTTDDIDVLKCDEPLLLRRDLEGRMG
ncbi:MAG: hypothetical protein PHE67_00215 [Campylobacterales bacterium]|nr:hypothetical protein [Campylobacterales bacterium]